MLTPWRTNRLPSHLQRRLQSEVGLSDYRISRKMIIEFRLSDEAPLLPQGQSTVCVVITFPEAVGDQAEQP